MLSSSRRYNNTSYTTEYGSFRGADFSSPQNDVDKRRSPDCLNVMVGAGGNLIKRPGFQLWATMTGNTDPVFGIFPVRTKAGKEWLYVHCGHILYRVDPDDGSASVCRNGGMALSRSNGIQYGIYLLIFSGSGYVCIDVEENDEVDPNLNGYIPLVIVNASPATGSGTTYEAINDLRGARRISYLGDGTTTVYHLPETAAAVQNVFVQYEAGEWTEYWPGVGSGCSFDSSTNLLTFEVAPPAPFTAGQPTVEFVYVTSLYAYSDPDKSKVCHCSCVGLCGIGGNGEERIFVSGNREYPNYDWHSEEGDTSAGVYYSLLYDGIDVETMPFYFPDTSYAVIGGAAPVVGYARVGEYQVILKKESAADSCIYLRTGGLDSDGNPVFAVTPGVAGTGVAAPGSIANFIDEPVFLTYGNGVCGVSISDIKANGSIVNRSWFLDGKLKKEPDKDGAVACVFNGYYILCFGHRFYVLDGRQSRTYREHSGGYVYEGYLWKCPGFAAEALCAGRTCVYMGDDEGHVFKMRFDLDEDNPARYKDTLITST